jgi:hypothetical protein
MKEGKGRNGVQVAEELINRAQKLLTTDGK